MYRSTRIAVCLLVLVFTIASFAKNTQVHPKEVSDEKYKPGQVWSYKTRTNESESTLTILRVEKIDGTCTSGSTVLCSRTALAALSLSNFRICHFLERQ